MQKAKSKNQKLEEKQDGGKLDPCADLRDKLARSLADYDNLVKRQARERGEIYLRATRNLVEDLLPVLDNLERAQDHLQDQGLKMGLESFVKVLDAHGVVEILTKIGDNFDSGIHEAIDSVEGDKPNTVAQVFSKGYQWKDGKVIRPAKVAVYQNKQPS